MVHFFVLCRSNSEHAYMIPKGTPVPDVLLLLQDRRWDFNKDYNRAYILAPAEPCYPDEFEQLFVDFVLRKNCYRLTRHRRIEGIPSPEHE